MTLQTGQVLNARYRIVKLLGQGGFGAVYRAWDINLNKPCAVKENLERGIESQRQFQREARVLANLSHPNLPRVFDHFSISGQGEYLVMDFVEGEDLASVLGNRGKVPLEQALDWMSQVADALTYLHTRNPPVVHRDIKPANIRITPDGKAMLVDFGLFKFYDPSKRTTAGARAITPGYAPPEQYGQGNTDVRTDIYALAATLYAALTCEEPVESVLRITGHQLPKPVDLNPAIPSHVGDAIELAMALDPAHRYQTVEEFQDAMCADETDVTLVRPVASGETQPASPPLATMRAPAPEAAPRTVAATSPPPTSIAQPTPQISGTAPPPPAPAARDWSATPSQPRRKGIPRIGVFAILLLVAGIVVVAGYWFLVPPASEDSNASATRIQSTVVAGAKATSTARVQATTTKRAAPNIEAELSQVHGPLDGSLVHNPANGLIKAHRAGLSLRDFVVDITFINPYGPDIGMWDIGFIFRHQSENQQYRLVIRSDRTWLLRDNVGQPDGEIIAKGTLSNLNLGEGSANYVKLICEGNQGQFFLNDVLVSELDLSSRSNSGDIAIATAIIRGDETQGYATDFTGLVVWAP